MSDESTMGRRGLILGAGAAALVGATGASTAYAENTAVDSPLEVAGSPISSTLASPPVSGYTYQHLALFDFQAQLPSTGLQRGDWGVYAANGRLWAGTEIPSGSRVRDVEWYVRNVSGAAVTAHATLWGAGSGSVMVLASATIPVSTGPVTTTRVVVPPATYGPYPLGCKLFLLIDTPGVAVQVSGARVGFDLGGGRTGLLSTPVRAYDSRLTGGRFGAGQTRTITLPASVVTPATSGVLLNITAHSAAASGWLKVYPGHGAVPGTSALNYMPGQSIANAMIVGVSSARQIKIYANQPVHVIVDISGTIA